MRVCVQVVYLRERVCIQGEGGLHQGGLPIEGVGQTPLLLPAWNRILTFTTGVTPTDLLVPSMVAESF